MKIITNHHDRHFLYGYEIPESVKNDFDWLDEDEAFDGWIHYRKCWYHISDFMVCSDSPDSEISNWHGYTSDSFFSGVLIRVSDDGESYQIATYLS